MVFENIEKLKSEYTDKYVIVDDTQPELQRFSGQTGTVRTVNMSGRALVEFDAYKNIGWYDIDVDFLKIVEQPLTPKEEPAAEKPAAKAKAKPKAAAKKPAAMSAADIMAAARGGGAAPASKKVDPKPAAAAKPKAAAKKPAAKADPSKMSAADILAAARGGSGAVAVGAGAASKVDDDIEVEEEPEVVAEAVAEVEEVVAEAPAAKAAASGALPTDVDAILAYCRECDGS